MSEQQRAGAAPQADTADPQGDIVDRRAAPQADTANPRTHTAEIEGLAGLTFGTATASYQVEGAIDADGRGRSIWDTFCAEPGRIADGSSGATACSSYERWPDDLALLRDLGVGAYRFSVAWPRVQPDGRTEINAKGLAYYERMVDDLLGADIQPLVTLYHWDLPQPLEDAGGWPERDTALRFADYALAVHDALGDRVTQWATLNEPWCSAFLGYAAGVHAPGRRDPRASYAAAHHLLLGHAIAARAMREADVDAEVGLVLNLTPVWPEDDAARDGAAFVDAVQNGLWLDALVDGRYPGALTRPLPGLPELVPAPLADPGIVRDGDLDTIAGSADWLGVNYYTPFRIASVTGGERAVGQDTAAYPGAPALAFVPREPRTAMGWEVEPRGLEELLVTLTQRAPGMPLRVTENGAAYDDSVRAADGSVRDEDRIAYLRGHLAAVGRARAAGADVRAYVAWTLLDNFEWAEGYTKRFGLVEVEPGSYDRRPKASFRWYADLVRTVSTTG